jgi:cytochrome b subunit of formate dehydrogenase
MATDHRKRAAGHRKRATRADVVERYRRPARWFHAGIYASVLILLATGWWLLAGREGSLSPLAVLTGMSDISLHKVVGWILAGLALAGLLLGIRAIPSFVAESLRLRRSEMGWFPRWPGAVFTGRFGWHEGRFDPGQRFLNVTLILGLALLVGSGVGLVLVHGGPMFVVLFQVHQWTTYPVTALVLGHILIAWGVLPGYHGVWRSMHLGGRLDARVARRLWPAWFRDSGRGHPDGHGQAAREDAHQAGGDPGLRAGDGVAGRPS